MCSNKLICSQWRRIGGLVGADALCSLHPFSVVKFYAVYWLVLYSTCFQNNVFQGIKASYIKKKVVPCVGRFSENYSEFKRNSRIVAVCPLRSVQ